mmetsp:Transcript_97493/g.275791  ORF Transcript_97493/g.275791 Transcript_97493/m.275791 type:complete len:83 (-) Transcript_97493:1074-1322(-)
MGCVAPVTLGVSANTSDRLIEGGRIFVLSPTATEVAGAFPTGDRQPKPVAMQEMALLTGDMWRCAAHAGVAAIRPPLLEMLP